MGLMIGVELDRPCTELVRMGLARGLVFNVTADNVIRLLPPLVMSEAEGAAGGVHPRPAGEGIPCRRRTDAGENGAGLSVAPWRCAISCSSRTSRSRS